jgi:hypothetical protein
VLGSSRHSAGVTTSVSSSSHRLEHGAALSAKGRDFTRLPALLASAPQR